VLGKSAKCPGCKAVFTAKTTVAEPEQEEEIQVARRRLPKLEEDYDDEEDATARKGRPVPEDDEEEESDEERERRRQARGTRADWARVRSGVTMVLTAICSFIGVALVLVCAGMVFGMAKQVEQGELDVPEPRNPAEAMRQQAELQRDAAQSPILKVLRIVSQVLFMGVAVLETVGYFFCKSVPRRTGAHGMAMLALACASGSLGITVINSILGFAGPGAGLAIVVTALSGLGSILSVGKTFAFLAFLRATAATLRKRGIARSARTLMILYACFVGLMVVGMGIAFAVLGAVALDMVRGAGGGLPAGMGAGGVGAGVTAAGCMVCIGGMVGVMFLIWYIAVLFQMREALAAKT
jgi:hypothetical protein